MKRSVPNLMLVVLAAASLLATAAITAAVLARTVRAGGVPSAAVEESEPRLPVMFDVPRFSLVDQDGEPFGSEDLDGKVWVADFMFTRCGAVCPMLSANMKALQEALKGKPYWDRVRLVSISVDAEHDTPAVLREYADRFKAEPGRWVFLTGPKEEVWGLSEGGFKLMVGENAGDAAMPINHASKFAVVDGRGRIRAYHEGAEASSRAALIADVEALLAEGSADGPR